MRSRLRLKPEVRLSVIYLIAGGLWIVFTDRLLNFVFDGDQSLLNTFQTYKGLIFILFTGALLYAFAQREFARQRRITQNVQNSERQFRYLFHSNPQPMWIYDLETLAFLAANAAAQQQYGYTEAEFLAMRITDIRPQDDVPRLLESLKQARPDLQHAGEWQHMRKDATLIDVEIISHMIEYDGRPASLVVARDVTERKRAQEALRLSEKRLTSILESMEDVVWSIEPGTFRLTYINHAAERAFKRSVESLLAEPDVLFEIVHPDDKDMVRASLNDLVETGYRSIQYRAIHTDGRLRWVRDRAWEVRDDTGRVIRYDGIATDITEHKRLQEELLEKEKMRAALNKEIEMRGLRTRFMSMMSHQFRNPLTTILTSSNLLQTYFDRMDDHARDSHLERIQSQVRSLVGLLDELLMVMRAEVVGMEFNPAPMDIEQLCHSLVEETRQNCQGSHTIVFNAGCDAHTVIQADEKLLRHVLDNLLSNAVKYSPPGSTITMDTMCEDGSVTIKVTDQGIGIPEQSLQRIFEAFHRADNVGATPGTGLGLTIARQAMDLHGGEITVESAVGSGTSFTLRLPVAAESVPDM